MLIKLIRSYFRKDLSHMVTFVLIVILSSLMLQAGLCLLFGYDSHFSRLAEEVNAPDISIYTVVHDDEEGRSIINEIQRSLDNSGDVDCYETKCGYSVHVTYKRSEDSEDSKDYLESQTDVYVFREYGEEEIDRPVIIEKIDGNYERPLIVSYNFLEDTLYGRYGLGDTLLLEINGTDYYFTITGIYEALADQESIYTDEVTIVDMKENMAYLDYEIFVKTVPGADELETFKSLRSDFDHKNIHVGMSRLSILIKDSTYMIDIISAVLCIFAVIVALVVAVVIYFRLTNSIEQNIVNLGALKALGATGSQIRIAHILEFEITAGAGFMISTLFLYALLPRLEELLRVFTYSKWDCAFNPEAFLITGGFIMGVTLCVSFISTSGIKKIDPVQALRFGLKSHSFRKNPFPVETTGGPLTGILALKSAFGNKRQNVLVITIMAVVGLMISIAIFIGFNVGYKPMNLYKLLMNSSTELDLYFAREVDPADIMNIEGVDMVWAADDITIRYNGIGVYTEITDDWSKVPGDHVVEGRVPVYDNEIAVGKTMAENNDIRIGDVIEINYYDKDLPMVVTGFIQSTYNYGDAAIITTEAAGELGYKPYTEHLQVTVKNSDPELTKEIIGKLILMYGDEIYYFDRNELVSSGDDEIIMVGKIISVALVILAAAIVLLSMTLLVKTIIIKTQRELGIKKALGFTGRQLRTELCFSMMPNIVIGLVIGSVLGIINANNLLSAILSRLGITRSNLETAPWMAVMGILGGSVVSYVIIWFLSRRIKKISAYSLINE
ncbi:MAG: ABC transporter permease [Clostridiales bacterium]|nr:ABC transporter permease [Clostridiales bacterium]